MNDTCKHCHLPIYLMFRPRTGEKLVHRGTHLAECATGGTTATPRSETK
ncbi:hypothetical protein [Prescottella equi]|nr:hypothetical protein [Prescottella equi]